MKFLMALGGFFAFAAIGAAGFAVGRDPARTVMEAALGAVAAALRPADGRRGLAADAA